jgi:hypothetical protein
MSLQSVIGCKRIVVKFKILVGESVYYVENHSFTKMSLRFIVSVLVPVKLCILAIEIELVAILKICA